MKHMLKLLIFQMQKILLNVSYYITKPFCYGKRDISWVVGTIEVAKYLYNISSMLDNAISVCLIKNRFYNYKYTYSIPNGFLSLFLKLFYAPILLGYLVNKTTGFFYISDGGFLLPYFDGRMYEFYFLKKKNKGLICCFLGSDIRSHKKSLEFADMHKIDVISTYYYLTSNFALSSEYDDIKQKLASSADRYADLIYNAPIDQMSYLVRESLPIFYIYPDDEFVRNDNKYDCLNEIKIVHAPSSPIIKGTQIVRASIKKLQEEGYKFKYIELNNVSNSKVLEELKEAHIVLNQFYAFVPSVFGIEAMANHCALLTSADCTIERCLPSDSNEAWLVTKYWQVYDNLKLLLDNPILIKEYADRGFDWGRHNASYSAVKKALMHDLSECFTK